MATIRFENPEGNFQREASNDFENHFILQTHFSDWNAWRDAFLQTVLRDKKELRHVFNSKLTLFWKLKEMGESRLLLAHPEKEEWVATIILNEEDANLVMKNTLHPFKQIQFSKLGIRSTMASITGRGNLDLTLLVSS